MALKTFSDPLKTFTALYGLLRPLNFGYTVVIFAFRAINLWPGRIFIITAVIFGKSDIFKRISLMSLMLYTICGRNLRPLQNNSAFKIVHGCDWVTTSIHYGIDRVNRAPWCFQSQV